MYVWARLFRTVLTARSRGRYRLGEESRLTFRCLPSDIDSNLHLNNARYMMLADIGRIDIFMRGGLLALARKNGWAPMMEDYSRYMLAKFGFGGNSTWFRRWRPGRTPRLSAGIASSSKVERRQR